MYKITKYSYLFSTFLLILATTSCKEAKKVETENTTETAEQMSAQPISKSEFGTLPNGTVIDKYTLTNANGIAIDVISYGGRITAIRMPDKNGKVENITLGFDKLEDYLADNPYFGALIGRYGNRIANAQFSIGENTYKLGANNGTNNLHGGPEGFDRAVWKVTPKPDGDKSVLVLEYYSKDGEMGYPGNLATVVTYTLDNDNQFEINYEAETDKATVINLTQHAYFNLSGDFSKPITDHKVKIDADSFLPVDENLIPTGEIRNVSGTPFDFTQSKTVSKEIDADNKQIALGGGYDHCWVLNGVTGNLRTSAIAMHAASGRKLEVLTTEPGIQFYTGNFLDGTLPNPAGGFYGKRSGFCLETQHYPDSPNQPKFPSTKLEPGERYKTTTIFKFSIE